MQKIPNTSHPNGVIISTETENNDYESCKRWCLYRCYCKAIDWDTVENTCWYHSFIDTESYRQDAATVGVMHVKKVDCGPPLNCFQHDEKSVMAENGDVVLDTEHEQVVCNGVCFITQDFSTTPQMVTRGCQMKQDDRPDIDCFGLTPSVFQCTCDTNRCNGLNIQLLANQKAYLPLDGDFSDHAMTFSRDASPADGRVLPKFSCTNSYSNCSAFFTGEEVIAIRELVQVVYGEAIGSIISPAFTVTAAVYPIDFSGSGNVGGIVGNSETADILPSFQMGIDGNQWSAGVLAMNNQGEVAAELAEQLGDYDPYVVGMKQQWRLLTMVYDGVENAATAEQASLQFYIDEDRQDGNSRRDIGLLQYRSEPFTIGVVQDKPFTGYIDEVRIFTTVLRPHDIKALITMSKAENKLV